MEFLLRTRVVRQELCCSAVANAKAPTGLMSFLSRSRKVSEVLCCSAPANFSQFSSSMNFLNRESSVRSGQFDRRGERMCSMSAGKSGRGGEELIVGCFFCGEMFQRCSRTKLWGWGSGNSPNQSGHQEVLPKTRPAREKEQTV